MNINALVTMAGLLGVCVFDVLAGANGDITQARTEVDRSYRVYIRNLHRRTKSLLDMENSLNQAHYINLYQIRNVERYRIQLVTMLVSADQHGGVTPHDIVQASHSLGEAVHTLINGVGTDIPNDRYLQKKVGDAATTEIQVIEAQQHYADAVREYRKIVRQVPQNIVNKYKRKPRYL